ncbi:PREDICTED: laminin subunit beta-3 [Tinamus guttatus]|uniref:laminin subunit beta-3 n=1 Tax=Tinamus guttatus TaxID=94827 RepID=UPI00052EC9A3|nr:PREDICTED: laminin subunit beta-3 [Tinamus guttatus]
MVLPPLLDAQRSCSHGACYPPVGDLLVGRIHHLKASSTCGLTKPETYCTPYGEWRMRCCRCDSRVPHSHNSHRVENVLASRGPLRWWQSQNSMDRVSLQLDLDKKFLLNSIVLKFRSLLPAAMLIERSTDFGKTWSVYQYLASDCAASFPGIPPSPAESWQDARCQALHAQHGYPLHGGTIKFSVQDLAPTISTSYSQIVNNLAEFTNLRVNFTQLAHIVHQGYHSPSTFYAVTEMQVQGSCFCNGHADLCAPSGDQHVVVHGHCVCQHNTAGPNCNHCADFYNDQPWRPAEDDNPHECQRCNCNGHSDSCHFDPDVYQASGGESGGVCDNCQHNTEGKNCERCKTNYFRNQRQDFAHPEACLPCECDPDGTVPGSVCDHLTGRCVCKDNVQGERCHLCKPGFTQLANANPQGCRRCTCNLLGSRPDMPCDDETGRCFCLPNVVGANCDQCALGYWQITSGQGCQPCDCHPHHSLGAQCNQFTGQCSCREGFTGRTCSAEQQQVCPDRHYGDVRVGCTECNCDFQGTEEAGCDKATGRCLCRPGVTGLRCDQCQRGHCSTYPQCELCHPCFQAYDGDIQRLSMRRDSLSNSTSQLHLGFAGSGFSARLSTAGQQAHCHQVKDLVSMEQCPEQHGPTVPAHRKEARGINPDLHFLDETASLSSELDTLNRSLVIINSQYETKKTQFETSRSTDISGAFKTIRSAYQTSSNASSLVAAASRLLTESRENRRSVEGLEGAFTDYTSTLQTLQGKTASLPNLTPVINKVCGGFRQEECTPARCEGFLCLRDNSTECGAALGCRGIFPLSRGALRRAEKASSEFRSLSARLQETARLIKATETSANQIQSNTQRLVEQMSVTRTQIEGDVRRIQQFIRKVRNFLSDRDTDPAAIQEISESVLSLRLPTDAAAVLRKMTEIQNLATKLQCPESILAQTADDIAKAKQLQQEAEQARNRANAVEGNVEEVVGNLRRANTVLLEAQGAIRGSSSSLRFIQERVDEIKAVLGPTESNVKSIAGQLDGLAERLSQLQHKADQNRLRASDAQQTAAEAGEQARSARQAFEQVKQMYAEVKGRMKESSTLGVQGSRLQSVNLEAKALLEETSAMMRRMETLETEIQGSNEAFISKSASLVGLEERVESIRDSIHKRVAYYDSC